MVCVAWMDGEGLGGLAQLGGLGDLGDLGDLRDLGDLVERLFLCCVDGWGSLAHPKNKNTCCCPTPYPTCMCSISGWCTSHHILWMVWRLHTKWKLRTGSEVAVCKACIVHTVMKARGAWL